MGLETGTYLDDLVPTNPIGATDPKSQGDDHLRLIKAVLKATFPGLGGSAFRIQTKSTNFSLATADNMSTLLCTGTLTITLPAAATLGNKHMSVVIAKGASVTFARSGSDTVNGLTAFVITFNQAAIVFCDGVSEYHVVMLGGVGGSFGTGDVKVSIRLEADVEPGWIVGSGTIGDASSSATNRANADCEALFKMLWKWDNAEAVVSGGRGVSAAADWAAHKTITVPDFRDRVIIGMGTVLGVAANRITEAVAGFDSNVIGAVGGDQRLQEHTHDAAPHDHDMASGQPPLSLGGNFIGNLPLSGAGASLFHTTIADTDVTIQNSGEGNSGNIPPGIVLNIFIKL